MSEGTDRLKAAWRDSVTEGIPASGPNEPSKAEIRAALDVLAIDIVAAGAGGDPEAVRAIIEPLRDDAVAAAGFALRSDAITFAPKMATGEPTTVYGEASGATRAAVAGEVRLDGTAATVGEQIPLNGRYTKQASGTPPLLRTGSLEDQLAKVSADFTAQFTQPGAADIIPYDARRSVGEALDSVEGRVPDLYTLDDDPPPLTFMNEADDILGYVDPDTGGWHIPLRELLDVEGNGLIGLYTLDDTMPPAVVVNEDMELLPGFGGSDSAADELLADLAGNRADADTRVSTALTAYGSVKQLCVGDYNLVELRQRAQALVQGDNTQLVIAIIGDSIHDAGAYNSAKAWIEDMYDVLGDAGFGYTSFTLLQAGVLTSYRGNARRALVPLTITGTWTREYIATDAPDRCGLISATAGDKITVAPTIAGAPLSAARLFFTGTADGVIRYRWNGGAWTSLNVQGTVGALQTALLASGMPASGIWVLELETVSGTVRPSGVDFQSAAKGVRFHNVSCSNIRTEHFAAANAAYWKAGMAALGAKVALIPLLTNDVAKSTVTPTTPTQLYGYAQTLCSRLREIDADIDLCWVAAWQNDYLTAQLPAFATFYPALEQLMDEMHGAFINMQFAVGPDPSRYKVGTARAFMVDLYHPSTAGTRLYQDAYYRLSPPKVNGN